MVIKESAHTYYRSLSNGNDNAKSRTILHKDKSPVSQWELIQKNAEIAQLRQQLMEVATKVWQSEQILIKLSKYLDLLDSPGKRREVEGIRTLIQQLRNSGIDQYFENNLAVDQNFIKRLQTKFSSLSSNDLRICSLLRLNLSTKEVAQKLGISAESANKARYRIRKKLALSRHQDLVRFLIDF